MYGWRKRIGLLVPSRNQNAEVQFSMILPTGISVNVERVFEMAEKPQDVNESMKRMNEDLPRAARYISHTKPDIIVWACTGASFWGGPGANTKLEDLIYKEVGIPAITTTTAMLEALKELALKKIAVATPYAEETNSREEAFLRNNGYTITKIKGLNLVSFATGDTYPEQAYKLAVAVDSPEADGVFISCTNFPTFEVLDFLEKDLHKPVVSAMQATVWFTLKKLGISEKIEKFGSLLNRAR
jgi:maleate isomerase